MRSETEIKEQIIKAADAAGRTNPIAGAITKKKRL